MMDLLAVAIGIGLAVSLVFSELFGLAAGGMVVPGYIALHLDRPLAVAATLGAALLTWFVVHLLSTLVIIYGKRRTVLMILVGYLIRMLFDTVPTASFGTLEAMTRTDLTIIGYIIPGLIAIWIDRQGIVETLMTLLTASVVVRLILILAFGTEMRL